MILTKEKAEDLDKILRHVSETSYVYEYEDIGGVILENSDENYVSYLYHILKNDPHQLLDIIESTPTDAFSGSENIKHFLHEGGFEKMFEDGAKKLEIQNEVDRLNREKLRFEVKNVKRIYRTYWWTFGLSIAGFILAAGKIIYDILYKS